MAPEASSDLSPSGESPSATNLMIDQPPEGQRKARKTRWGQSAAEATASTPAGATGSAAASELVAGSTPGVQGPATAATALSSVAPDARAVAAAAAAAVLAATKAPLGVESAAVAPTLAPPVPMADVSARAVAARVALEKARKALALQKQIQEQVNALRSGKLAAGSGITDGGSSAALLTAGVAAALRAAVPPIRPLKFDHLGREVDESGRIIEIKPSMHSTLKVNINKDREEKLKQVVDQTRLDRTLTNPATNVWFDPTLSTAVGSNKTKKKALVFVERGFYVRKERVLKNRALAASMGISAESRQTQKKKQQEEEAKLRSLLQYQRRSTSLRQLSSPSDDDGAESESIRSHSSGADDSDDNGDERMDPAPTEDAGGPPKMRRVAEAADESDALPRDALTGSELNDDAASSGHSSSPEEDTSIAGLDATVEGGPPAIQRQPLTEELTPRTIGDDHGDDDDDDTAALDHRKPFKDWREPMLRVQRKHIGLIPDMEWWDAPLLRAVPPPLVEAPLLDTPPHHAALRLHPTLQAVAGSSVKADPSVQQSYDEVPVSHEFPYLIVESVLNALVEHPIPIAPIVDLEKPAAPLMLLTPQERAKLKKRKRQQAERDKQLKIRMGLIPPPPPKIKLSNLANVLSSSATADPSRLEAKVRQDIAQRQKDHEARNEARKLDDNARRKKTIAKWTSHPENDNSIPSQGCEVGVFVIRDLSNRTHLFKVDKNAQQYHLTGAALVCPHSSSLLIVEGTRAALKGYKKLLLRRVRWVEGGIDEQPSTKARVLGRTGTTSSVLLEGIKVDNVNVPASELVTSSDGTGFCNLVWQGVVANRAFKHWRIYVCRTESEARKILADRRVEHYWDMTKKLEISALAS